LANLKHSLDAANVHLLLANIDPFSLLHKKESETQHRKKGELYHLNITWNLSIVQKKNLKG